VNVSKPKTNDKKIADKKIVSPVQGQVLFDFQMKEKRPASKVE
jgi:hypothetical protein